MVAGEDVISESPYVSVCLDPNGFCNCCYVELGSTHRDTACSRCVDVRYCSPQCRVSDEPNHRLLCGRAERELRASCIGPIARLAAAIFMKVGVARLLRRDEYEKDDFSTIASMVDSTQLRSPQNLLQYGFLACFLTDMLAIPLKLDQLDAKQHNRIGARLLHLLQVHIVFTDKYSGPCII